MDTTAATSLSSISRPNRLLPAARIANDRDFWSFRLVAVEREAHAWQTGALTPALIGESPEMKEVTEHLRRIAPSMAAVMLVGESGTGKEVAAELLHAHSLRAGKPFVSVNCGAIPANLVEAELFGYERGAFTGRGSPASGIFRTGAGGTLFLDEITEMPIDLQAKLLRVLESGRMVRVGGSEEIPLDVRIVTATNRSSEAAVRDRVLREDLYYRLAVFLVRLPPLRRRGNDIELLANAFLDAAQPGQRDGEEIRPLRARSRRHAFVAGERPRAQELHRAQLRAVGRGRQARHPAGARRFRHRLPATATACGCRSASRWRTPSASSSWRRCAIAAATSAAPPTCSASASRPCTTSSGVWKQRRQATVAMVVAATPRSLRRRRRRLGDYSGRHRGYNGFLRGAGRRSPGRARRSTPCVAGGPCEFQWSGFDSMIGSPHRVSSPMITPCFARA